MPKDFLHNHPDFPALIGIVARERNIALALVEKDYWIMHCLYGLQKLGMKFELKGGTSLSKGWQLIHRFSEDIDIWIEPPANINVKKGRNHDKPEHRESRKKFYDCLAKTIKINGIYDVQRDTIFDDVPRYRSGGIRLFYRNIGEKADSLKDGVLLEVGFDDVKPNSPKTISSWAYDYAVGKVQIIDNRAVDVACYHPGYTLVEKLQTISTKYRQQQESGKFPVNFMRHYYDVYCLLQDKETIKFIGTTNYIAHKDWRFRAGDNQVIAENEAFLLRNPATRGLYKSAYGSTRTLYYQEQPEFEAILEKIGEFKEML